MKALHTATPWYSSARFMRSSVDAAQGFIYQERTGKNIAVTYNPGDEAFIELCVNNHDDLVNMLAHLTSASMHAMGMDADAKTPPTQMGQAIDAARALLAKVQS